MKQLYASAFRCAKPGCSRPLYTVHDDTGELVLNSRVAHIHARRLGGPRWMDMSSEQNRSPSNLVLLCIEHSYEVDDFPGRFPVDMLREWKKVQFEEYQRIQRGWPLSDAEAGEAIEASSPSVDHHHARAVLGAVRAAERLSLMAPKARLGPASEADAWLATRARAHRITVWDQDGNTLHAEPSSVETRRHKADLEAALARACEELSPLADDVKVELAAARTSRPSIEPWARWVSQAVDEVLASSGKWPAPPELVDDDQLDVALEKLAEARDAFGAAWRGEDAPSPPPPPEPQPESIAMQSDPLKEHLALLERGRPFARVEHRPYDAALRAELADAASAASGVPPVASALTLGLGVTCMLAAAVAANADDEELAALAERDAKRRPLSAAFCLLAESSRTAQKRVRRGAEEVADAALLSLWNSVDWSDSDAWDPADLNLGSVFWAGARATSPEGVSDKLSHALEKEPGLLSALLRGCAEWVESYDRETGAIHGRRRRYRDLPPWFPVAAVTEMATAASQVKVDEFGETTSDDAESLLAQVLWLAAKHNAV